MDNCTTILLKRCSKCKVEYPATTEFFYRDKNSKIGLTPSCKACQKKYQEANAERLKEYKRRHYIENQSIYKKRSRDRYYADPQKDMDRTAEWRRNNTKRSREIKAKYKKAHPEQVHVDNLRRRERLRGQRIKFSKKDVLGILTSQNSKCWWCGKKLVGEYHIDHRIPLSRGGKSEIRNLCATCPECNLKKNAKMPWEFNGRLL